MSEAGYIISQISAVVLVIALFSGLLKGILGLRWERAQYWMLERFRLSPWEHAQNVGYDGEREDENKSLWDRIVGASSKKGFVLLGPVTHRREVLFLLNVILFFLVPLSFMLSILRVPLEKCCDACERKWPPPEEPAGDASHTTTRQTRTGSAQRSTEALHRSRPPLTDGPRDSRSPDGHSSAQSVVDGRGFQQVTQSRSSVCEDPPLIQEISRKPPALIHSRPTSQRSYQDSNLPDAISSEPAPISRGGQYTSGLLSHRNAQPSLEGFSDRAYRTQGFSRPQPDGTEHSAELTENKAEGFSVDQAEAKTVPLEATSHLKGTESRLGVTKNVSKGCVSHQRETKSCKGVIAMIDPPPKRYLRFSAQVPSEVEIPYESSDTGSTRYLSPGPSVSQAVVLHTSSRSHCDVKVSSYHTECYTGFNPSAQNPGGHISNEPRSTRSRYSSRENQRSRSRSPGPLPRERSPSPALRDEHTIPHKVSQLSAVPSDHKHSSGGYASDEPLLTQPREKNRGRTRTSRERGRSSRSQLRARYSRMKDRSPIPALRESPGRTQDMTPFTAVIGQERPCQPHDEPCASTPSTREKYPQHLARSRRESSTDSSGSADSHEPLSADSHERHPQRSKMRRKHAATDHARTPHQPLYPVLPRRLAVRSVSLTFLGPSQFLPPLPAPVSPTRSTTQAVPLTPLNTPERLSESSKCNLSSSAQVPPPERETSPKSPVHESLRSTRDFTQRSSRPARKDHLPCPPVGLPNTAQVSFHDATLGSIPKDQDSIQVRSQSSALHANKSLHHLPRADSFVSSSQISRITHVQHSLLGSALSSEPSSSVWRTSGNGSVTSSGSGLVPFIRISPSPSEFSYLSNIQESPQVAESLDSSPFQYHDASKSEIGVPAKLPESPREHDSHVQSRPAAAPIQEQGLEENVPHSSATPTPKTADSVTQHFFNNRTRSSTESVSPFSSLSSTRQASLSSMGVSPQAGGFPSSPAGTSGQVFSQTKEEDSSHEQPWAQDHESQSKAQGSSTACVTVFTGSWPKGTDDESEHADSFGEYIGSVESGGIQGKAAYRIVPKKSSQPSAGEDPWPFTERTSSSRYHQHCVADKPRDSHYHSDGVGVGPTRSRTRSRSKSPSRRKRRIKSECAVCKLMHSQASF